MIIRPVQPTDNLPADAMEIEGEIKEFVRKSRESADKKNEAFGNGVADTMQRVASTSVAEVDRLITELTQLRSRLQNECRRVQNEIARVQGEIAGYTQTSEAAIQSIRAIDHSLGQFKRAVAPSDVN